MFLDQEITEKGIGREKTYYETTWASPRIPDVSGMLPDVSGMSGTIKTEHTPSAQTDLPPPNQPADALLLHLGQPRNSPRKGREGDRFGEGLHQD